MSDSPTPNTASEATPPPESPQPPGRGWRWLRRVLLWVVYSLLGLLLLFQLPFVQQWLSQQVVDALEDRLQTEVTLDKARLMFFDRLRLDQLFVEDVYGDTLLTSPRLTANFNLNPFVLLTRGVEIEALYLEGTRFNIRRATGDSLSNIQIALRRLFPPRDQPAEREPSSFALQLKQLELVDVQFSQSDSINGSLLNIRLGRGFAEFQDIDLPNKRFLAENLILESPEIRVMNYNGTPLPPSLERLDSLVRIPDSLATFPFFAVEDFSMVNGRFLLDNYRRFPVRNTPEDQLDFQHLDVREIKVDLSGFHYHRDTFAARVNLISARERSGFTLDTLAAREAVVSPRGLTLHGLALVTPQSRIGDTLRFRYQSYADWIEFPDRVRLDARINGSEVTLEDIIAFAPALENNPFFRTNRYARLRLDGHLSGPVNRLRGQDLNIELTDGTTLEGNFSTYNLTDKGEEFLHLELDRLRTRMHTLRQLIPNFNPPENFDNLGRLDFSGRFDGFFVDFVANGQLRSNIGRAEMDMRMDLKRGARNANYSGNLRLIDFDLGAWSGNPDLGVVNFSSQVLNGVGLTGETASAELTAAIETFTFRDYTYQNATLTGELNRNFFNGDFAIQDDNIDFSFRGELDFRDSVPAFDFYANVNRLDMRALNLSPLDLVVAGKVDLNLRDTRLADIEGSLRATQVRLTKDRTDNYRIDSLVAFSYFNPEGLKVLKVDSDVLTGEITGNFDIDELAGSFSHFLVRNYPGFSERLKITSPKDWANGNQFDYNFHLIDSKGLNWIVDPKLGKVRDTYLQGSYHGTENVLALDLQMPELAYDNFRFRDIIVRVDAQGREGDLDIVIDSTYINDQPRFSTVTLLSILQGDTINFGLNYRNDEPKLLDVINLNGLFFLPDSTHYGIRFKQSDLSLMNMSWLINADNYISFGEGTINIDDFVLTNQERRITMRNHGPRGVRLQLTQFDFNFIDAFWRYEPLNFDGDFDLVAQVDNVFELKGINAALTCDTFRINNRDFGSLRLDANTPDTRRQVSTYLSITQDTAQLLVEGVYNLGDMPRPGEVVGDVEPERRKNFFRMNINVGGYPLDIAEFWIGEGITDTEGSFDANLTISGRPDRPNVEGFINARDGAFTLVPLQTRYHFERGFISADNYNFSATGTFIYDEYGNRATVYGGITHNRLRNLGLDARLRTTRFLALDLEKGENELFYGQAFGSGEVRFTGNFQQPNIYVNATVGDSTRLSIPINDQADASGLEQVRFVNKYQEKQTTELGERNRLTGLNLEMDLTITEVAEMELIFDEQAGDIIRGNGSGNLRILLPRTGDFKMYGDVTISRGNYLFTMYNVINKDFSIREGGRITWNGDPFSARIQLEAEYKDLSTSLSTFIQEYLLNASPELKNQATAATDVDLTLKLQGELLRPNIGFDIRFPDLRGPLQTYADNKLRLLRQDQSELNRQVFGLIVVGQFLPSDLSFTSGEVITNTLSEYFSNQLSLLINQLFSEVVGEDNFLSGLNFDIDYNQYNAADLGTGQTFSSGEQLEVTVRTTFLDDRLSLQLGGNVGFGDELLAANNGAFIGNDVVIEYVINRNRTLTLRVYQLREPDFGGGSRLQIGGGLSWRREFNSFAEFWRELRRRGKENRDGS